MSRRRRSSTLEDVTELVAALPWWMGVGLAALSYLLLSTMAVPQSAPTVQPGQIGGVAAATLLRTLASIGQYLLPFLCLVGAAASAWRRSTRCALARNVQASKAAGALDGMSWQEFEMLVGEAFRRRGFRVDETGGAGPDGGVDLVLKKGAETFLVQCKQWRALKVGVDVVRQLYGVMAARGAAGGFVVTSGRFTDEARRFAEGRNLRLVDGEALMKLIGAVTPRSLAAAPAAPAAEAPACPQCASAMVRRVTTRGANAGKAFWGCATYPACRGTRVAES